MCATDTASSLQRCGWAGDDPLYIAYHDKEWGVPLGDEQKIFEFLILEGFQAGLSWITILKKRDNFRASFDRFNAEKIARYTHKKISKLQQDAGIIRNRLKIAATVSNAQAYLAMRERGESLAGYFWDKVDGRPIQNRFKTMQDIPSETKLSQIISKELKKKGYKFVGPTIIYAHMQAMGLVNDHVIDCPCHALCMRYAARFKAPK